MMSLPLADNRSWIVPAILVVLSWGASAFWGYHSSDLEMATRIIAVETQQRIDSANDKDRLNRIEDKLDRLYLEVTGKRP